MTSEQMEKERTLFEQWQGEQNNDDLLQYHFSEYESNLIEYNNISIDYAWQGWLARAEQSQQSMPNVAELNEYLYWLCNGRFVYNNRNEELDFTDLEQMRAVHATLMYLYQESHGELQVKNGKDYPLFD